MKTPDFTGGARLLTLLALLPLLLAVDLLRSRNLEVDMGNAALKAGKAEEALQAYDKAAETLTKDPGVHFNRGSALYNLQRYEDAAQAFLRATEARPAPLKASAFYNLGNSFAKASKWGEAVEAYKKSLVYAPRDIKTKWNLELALRKKRDEDKQKQDNKDGKPDNKNKDGEKKEDDKGAEAKNDPSQSGDENSGDKEGEGDRNAEDDQEKKDQEKPGQEDKEDKGEKKPQEQQANKDEQKPPEPGKQQQDKQQQQQEQQQQQQQEKQAKGGGKQQEGKPAGKDQPGKQQSADLAEMEAILDNLEKSPKALEQELARLRAFQRRPPAKDW